MREIESFLRVRVCVRVCMYVGLWGLERERKRERERKKTYMPTLWWPREEKSVYLTRWLLQLFYVRLSVFAVYSNFVVTYWADWYVCRFNWCCDKTAWTELSGTELSGLNCLGLNCLVLNCLDWTELSGTERSGLNCLVLNCLRLNWTVWTELSVLNCLGLKCRKTRE